MVREIALHEGSLASVAATESDWRRMLARADVAVLLAFRQGAAIGYASTSRRLNLWLAGDVVALDDLWVRPEHRNTGAGARLMHAVADLADGATIVWGARVDNVAAHRFYERLGAVLSTKTVAVWTPQSYRSAAGHLASPQARDTSG